ncbi:MAG: rhodanese-like domain-containing protein, partial [Myxococcota bacterium]
MDSWLVPAVVFVTLLLAWKFWKAYRSPAQLREIAEALHGGAKLVDVRTAMEFSSGHLPGADNRPLGSFDGRSGELGDKARPVVVYCASGTRSAHAARQLRRAGYEKVLDLGPMFNGNRLPA